jgi:hypothetical protein
MPDIVLDDSTPCCLDTSRWPKTLKDQCAFAKKLLAGATGGVGTASTGTWSSSLNATGGGSGGGTGDTWTASIVAPSETWG